MTKVVMLGASLLMLAFASVVSAGPEPRVVSIGDLQLESGQLIRDCKIGFVTVGKLNEERSNVVVFPTWFSGTYRDILPFLGPGKLVDTTKYFVVIIDALGDGVSASPSNFGASPRDFPAFTIRDMVNSQHALLTRELHFTYVKAVMGISMGGLQTFQWMVSYPDFMDKAIAITGSPRPAPSDLFLFYALLHALDQADDLSPGSQAAVAAMRTVAAIVNFANATPRYTNGLTNWDDFTKFRRKAEDDIVANLNPWNFRAQLQALISNNVADARFGGSLERAAATVKARAMIVVAAEDHMVNPAPALAFAKLLQAATAVLPGECGHQSVFCEQAKLYSAVGRFLNK